MFGSGSPSTKPTDARTRLIVKHGAGPTHNFQFACQFYEGNDQCQPVSDSNFAKCGFPSAMLASGWGGAYRAKGGPVLAGQSRGPSFEYSRWAVIMILLADPIALAYSAIPVC